MIQLITPPWDAVKLAFAGGFNNQIALACSAVSPPLTPFELNFGSGEPRNYWDGPPSFDFLWMYLARNQKSVPALCLYAGPVDSRGRPATFDGFVQIGGAVFLRFDPDTQDFETWVRVVQAALTGI